MEHALSTEILTGEECKLMIIGSSEAELAVEETVSEIDPDS
jgi:hypothetical protein